MLCCLLPYGDTVEPRAFPGDVFYKRSQVQHVLLQRPTWRQATLEMSKTKHRPRGRSQHGGMCMPTVLHVPSGGGACMCVCIYCPRKPKEGWAVVEQFLPVLGHQPPSCSLASICNACIHPAVTLHSMRTLRPGGKLCEEELFCSSQWQLGRLWSTVKHCRAHVDLGSPQGVTAHRNQKERGYR